MHFIDSPGINSHWACKKIWFSLLLVLRMRCYFADMLAPLALSNFIKRLASVFCFLIGIFLQHFCFLPKNWIQLNFRSQSKSNLKWHKIHLSLGLVEILSEITNIFLSFLHRLLTLHTHTLPFYGDSRPEFEMDAIFFWSEKKLFTHCTMHCAHFLLFLKQTNASNYTNCTNSTKSITWLISELSFRWKSEAIVIA